MRILHLGAGGTAMGNATGQTLRSLFLDVPPDDVAEAVYGAGGSTTVLTIPESAAPVDLVLRGGVRIVRRLRGAGNEPVPTGLNDAIRVGPLSARQQMWRDLRAMADVSPVRLPGRFLSDVQVFRPDVIYTMLGNVRIMKLAVALSDRLDVPIVPHFMDDWPSTLYPNHELGGRARVAVRRALEQVIERSPVVVCIGARMAEEYQAEFGRPAYVAAYGIEETVTPAYEAPKAGLPRRLVYAGGLHLGRQQALEWAASCLSGTDWTVVVYAPRAGAAHPNIHYMDPVPVEGIPASLAEADALLFVESLEPKVAEYTRLSVSTKTAQYVGSNRPVVLIGPPEQASIELLEQSLPSYVRVDSVSAAACDEMRRFLESGLPSRLEAHPIPNVFSGMAMRESLRAAVDEAVKRWSAEDVRER